MKRIFAVVLLLGLGQAAASAQGGATIETPDDLKATPDYTRATRSLVPVPARVSLTGKIPQPRSQADTSTCTSWAATYAAASAAVRKAGAGDQVTLSPAFTYNQISHDSFCRAATSVSKTLDLLKEQGALPIDEFVFNAGWCGRMPTEAERQRAQRYRIGSWSWFAASDVDRVKEHLARGVPVIFTMVVGQRFAAFRGDGILTGDDGAINAHSMVVVGYDDDRRAFAIQNSAGRNWGDGGYAWISYDYWKNAARVAYVIN